MFGKLLLLAFVSVFIHACASLNAQECATANWHALGLKDGSEGLNLNRFDDHRRACTKHGINPVFAEYQQGYDQGIRRYCVPERGYYLGKRDWRFPNHCPADLLDGMQLAYNLGQGIYAEKKSLKRELRYLKDKIHGIDDAIALIEAERQQHLHFLAVAEKGLADPTVPQSQQLWYYSQSLELKDAIAETDSEIEVLELDKIPYYEQIDLIKIEMKALDNKPYHQALKES